MNSIDLDGGRLGIGPRMLFLNTNNITTTLKIMQMIIYVVCRFYRLKYEFEVQCYFEVFL